MDARTKEALKASIRHWEQVAAATNYDEVRIGAPYCALCALYNNDTHDDDACCVACPVYAETGAKFCEKTPFIAAWDAKYVGRDFGQFHRAAQRELDFLRSLLPTEEA